MISDTGENLSVLVVSEASVPNEWMSYAAWYSLLKNAPDAKTSISCQRTDKRMHQLMNWANRLKINYEYHNKFSKENVVINKFHSIVCALNRGFIKLPFLVIDPDIILIRELQLGVLNEKKKLIRSVGDKAWFFSDFSPKDFENIFDLYAVGKTDLLEDYDIEERLVIGTRDNAGFFVSVEDGVGRFNTRTWIDKNKGCPFGKAFRFYKDEMSVNEKKVLELWGQMAPLFGTVF